MTDLEGYDDLDLDTSEALQDVEFNPDGTNITDPYQDALGQVYESHDDYVNGTDPYEITEVSSDGTAEAWPV
ncbi:hypothetical protein [Geodermatophilus chilensis]|uniref:hypothetical protein n=1 Tax=Geodermatophilus chilensis TaxID=2035835 RepID=UPI000C2615BF|nr:hypothetical protein [Geodermatophilus chilensis]